MVWLQVGLWTWSTTHIVVFRREDPLFLLAFPVVLRSWYLLQVSDVSLSRKSTERLGWFNGLGPADRVSQRRRCGPGDEGRVRAGHRQSV